MFLPVAQGLSAAELGWWGWVGGLLSWRCSPAWMGAQGPELPRVSAGGVDPWFPIYGWPATAPLARRDPLVVAQGA